LPLVVLKGRAAALEEITWESQTTKIYERRRLTIRVSRPTGRHTSRRTNPVNATREWLKQRREELRLEREKPLEPKREELRLDREERLGPKQEELRFDREKLGPKQEELRLEIEPKRDELRRERDEQREQKGIVPPSPTQAQ
jgi:hypothetical protein